MRQTFHKAEPGFAPCLLPRSKLVLTRSWRLISSKDASTSLGNDHFTRGEDAFARRWLGGVQEVPHAELVAVAADKLGRQRVAWWTTCYF